MNTAASARRQPALCIWEPRPDDLSVNPAVELRLVWRHRLGQTSCYGGVRTSEGLHPLDVTIWPLGQRPDDPAAQKHASGHYYKVELRDA